MGTIVLGVRYKLPGNQRMLLDVQSLLYTKRSSRPWYMFVGARYMLSAPRRSRLSSWFPKKSFAVQFMILRIRKPFTCLDERRISFCSEHRTSETNQRPLCNTKRFNPTAAITTDFLVPSRDRGNSIPAIRSRYTEGHGKHDALNIYVLRKGEHSHTHTHTHTCSFPFTSLYA